MHTTITAINNRTIIPTAKQRRKTTRTARNSRKTSLRATANDNRATADSADYYEVERVLATEKKVYANVVLSPCKCIQSICLSEQSTTETIPGAMEKLPERWSWLGTWKSLHRISAKVLYIIIVYVLFHWCHYSRQFYIPDIPDAVFHADRFTLAINRKLNSSVESSDKFIRIPFMHAICYKLFGDKTELRPRDLQMNILREGGTILFKRGRV